MYNESIHWLSGVEALSLRVIKGVEDVVRPFSWVFMDIWGVLHNGIAVFDDVIPCLKALKKAEKKVVLFSNAPRLANHIRSSLKDMGISPDLYTDIVSSGIHVHDALRLRPPTLGDGSFFVIGNHFDPLEGLDYRPVEDVSEANFLFVTGPDSSWSYPQDYQDFFHQTIERGLPMVCANPDPYVMIDSKEVLCAGQLGHLYEDMGGKVMWYGKPYAPFYLKACAHFGIQTKDVLAIGDSMWTDIQGASSLDIENILILETGVHQGHTVTDLKALELFLKKFKTQPSYVLETLRW